MRLATLEGIGRELGNALRRIRRSPAFAVTVVIALTLGLGANIAMFATLDRVLFQAPPGVRDPDAVRRLFRQTQRSAGEGSHLGTHFGLPSFIELARAAGPAAQLAGYEVMSGRVLDDGSKVNVAYVTPGYFHVLGVRPARGRFFASDEERIGDSRRVIVVSHALWQRLGAPDSLVGGTVRIDSIAYTVTGIAQPLFEGLDLDVVGAWAPLAARPSGTEPMNLMDPGMRLLRVLARFNGAESTHETATAAMSRAVSRMEATYSGDSSRIISAPLLQSRGPLRFAQQDEQNLALAKRIAAIAAVVLLVTVANIASLLLMRTIRRRHEIAVRLALGAPREQLVAEQISESLLLALGGGALAALVGWWGASLLRSNLLANVQWSAAPSMSRSLQLATLVAVVVGLVAGVLPAIVAARRRSLDALRSDTAVDDSGSRLRFALLASQTALCLVLLSVAGAFLLSIRRQAHTDIGFDPAGRQTAYFGAGRFADALAEVHERLARQPGVVMSASSSFDLRPALAEGVVSLAAGRPSPSGISTSINYVDSNYFRAAGLRVVGGRGIGARDVAGGEPVAVVSETAKRIFWAGADPVGSCLELSSARGYCYRVIGVMRDVRWNVSDPPHPQIFFSLAQARGAYGEGFLIIRTDTLMPPTPNALADLLGRTLGLPGGRVAVRRIEERLASFTAPRKAASTMILLFGVLALLATAVGVYGLVSYDVALRTRELGIRIVMGASAADVLVAVVGSAARAMSAGLVIGLIGAVWAGRAMSAFLFETPAYDPLTIGMALLTILITALVASALPALRTARIEPVAALRTN